MAFIMLNWLNIAKKVCLLCLLSLPVHATSFSGHVNDVSVSRDESTYYLNAHLVFTLSPTAKEALQKGIALTWVFLIQVKKERAFWDLTLVDKAISFRVKRHTLLNYYSVDSEGKREMFSSLAAVRDSISSIRRLPLVNKRAIDPRKKQWVAVKLLFEREALPIPLRPISYFTPEWALSSEWVLTDINEGQLYGTP